MEERKDMAPEIGSWHHVAIPVPDVDKGEEWYTRVLNGEVWIRQGYSEKDVRAGRNRQIFIQAGNAIINLAEGEPIQRPPGLHFYHYAMSAPADQLDDWIEHLRSNGVEVMGPYGHGGNPLLSLYFDDPWGYRIELTFDMGDYETAKAAAIARGGALGNPDGEYEWE